LINNSPDVHTFENESKYIVCETQPSADQSSVASKHLTEYTHTHNKKQGDCNVQCAAQLMNTSGFAIQPISASLTPYNKVITGGLRLKNTSNSSQDSGSLSTCISSFITLLLLSILF
jgi:hypothetical protein